MKDLQEMCNADLMHYAREQRKYIFNHYEKFKQKHECHSLTWYIQKIYIPAGYAEKFHVEFMAKHRLARDYLATVTPKNK